MKRREKKEARGKRGEVNILESRLGTSDLNHQTPAYKKHWKLILITLIFLGAILTTILFSNTIQKNIFGKAIGDISPDVELISPADGSEFIGKYADLTVNI